MFSYQMAFPLCWPLLDFNLTNKSMNPISLSSSHQKFGFMMQIIAMNSNQDMGILELYRLYCQAFSATRGKKLSKEVKKFLVALLETMEKLIRKSYCEFVSIFARFFKIKYFFLYRARSIGIFSRICCLISLFLI